MATVYVSPTGSDAYTYEQAQSSATPWLTIGKCNTSATNGDTVVLMDGTHTWASVTFTKGFLFQAQNNYLAILDGGGGIVTWLMGADGLVFTFTGVLFQNAICAAETSLGESIFKNQLTYTITWTFANCKFITLGVNNKIGGGLFGNTNNYCATILTMTNCLFYDIYRRSSSTNAPPLIASNYNGNSTYTLTGCTFYTNRTAGNTLGNIFKLTNIGTGTITITVKNCIFADGQNQITWISGTPTTITVTYSDFYQITSPTAGTGNITSDPLFVDAANGNFNLRPTSPCIDTGTLV